MLRKVIISLAVIFLSTSSMQSQTQEKFSPPLAISSGKSIFRTIEKKIYLKTANNRRPTMRQLGIVFSADFMIYDENARIGYANGNLRFADPENTMFISAEEGTYFIDSNKIVLQKTPEILIAQDENTSSRIVGKIITIYPNDSYIHVQGNIEIDDGTTFITGKEAQIWSKEDRMLITGIVQSISDEQKLTTDSLDIQFINGDLASYTASGNVKAVNNVDKFTTCASILTYDHQQELFRATENPSIYFQEDRIISFANVIEYDRRTKIGNLLGNVISIQQNNKQEEIQRAYSRWAVYNGNSNIVNMYGNPRVVQKDSELFGMEIIIDITSNIMQVIGGGQGIFNRTQ
ncbi:MAG: LptA/OstA family protein [Brevinema sp.]